jgi:NAD(P)-dependent dehydrogenase (short-subunit alcohol dehydrogenase family)
MTIELSFDQGAVIVGGGTGGIGEAICRRFAEAGAPVIFTYNSNVAKAEAIGADIEAAGGECSFSRVDLSDTDSVNALFEDAVAKYGRIAHVIYAAGPSFDFAKIGDIPADTWKKVINADVNGAFNLIQSAVQVFRQQGGGNLIGVITSAVECVPKADIMSASPKAAIEMLIRGVAKESGKVGIRANCVGPGWINAGLGKKGMEEKMTPEMVEKLRRSTIPLQKFGNADDIAYACLFLCSQQAGFVTGQTLAVDGGAQI